MYVKDRFEVIYGERTVGYYYVFNDGSSKYRTAWGSPWDIEDELQKLGLDKETENEKPLKQFSVLMSDENRVKGRKKIIYRDGLLRMERYPEVTGERFSVYRCYADKGDPDYSPIAHDAPHYEGPHTPEGMREWASWYAFNRMDDGTYEAELDEAWCWGGSHNDGGTIHAEIPEEWFRQPYEKFIENVVGLAHAVHFGFTAEMLLEKEGLREFFGFEEQINE